MRKNNIHSFVLAENAWNAEVKNFKPYFATTTTDSTTKAASWNRCK
jgi:hypothetical protein